MRGWGQPGPESHLEHMRHDGPVVAGPGLLHQVSIGLRNLTLHAQRVAEVELLQVAVLEEVLSELRHITEALQEAEPSQVRQRRGERGDHGGDREKEAKRKDREGGQEGGGEKAAAFREKEECGDKGQKNPENRGK